MGILEQLKGRLIVSCQAEKGSPFDSPEAIAAFAKSAAIGGAAAIRSCGIEKVAYLLLHSDLPIIGLTKSYFDDGSVRITGSFDEFESLVKLGIPIIAVDGTSRTRDGYTGPDFIIEAKKRYRDIVIMADISTCEEAIVCYNAGVDCISTTLSGYTPYTEQEYLHEPSIDLVEACVNALPGFPIFAEGRYNTPEKAAKAIKAGAWAVVVGSAITRPHLITEWFVEAINHLDKLNYKDSL